MSKCPQCKHNYTSKTHKTRCLRQKWTPRKRASRAPARGSWASFNSSTGAAGRIVADGSFYEGVIHSTSPEEVTA